jgi:hypothetical protein
MEMFMILILPTSTSKVEHVETHVIHAKHVLPPSRHASSLLIESQVLKAKPLNHFRVTADVYLDLFLVIAFHLLAVFLIPIFLIVILCLLIIIVSFRLAILIIHILISSLLILLLFLLSLRGSLALVMG